MTWKIDGDIVGSGDRNDPQNVVAPAVRTAIQQRLAAATQIGSRPLAWVRREINAAARAVEYEATFEGDITANDARNFAIAIYGQSPVRGRLWVAEKDNEMTWFQIKILALNWSVIEFSKPPTVTRFNGSRASW